MTNIEAKAMAWDAMMDYLSRNAVFLSLREARKVVGGAAHLDSLIREGKVHEIDQDVSAPNCKRRFFASDVYAHVRAYKK